MPQPPPELVEVLRDRYTIERELGRGGMATVYLAHDLRHDRLVALKVLHRELGQALGPERFLQEIHLAARLQHPHLLSVHDSGEARGRLWFTMPFVEGESLRDRLRRERQLPVDDALRITYEAARALDYAHRHGVIHRDIKPENILLTEDGDTLVADFGIGRALGAGPNERITETGTVVGTPAYMSPEQAAGERDLEGRSDVYSLGCVLYEMLAGEPPFTGPTAQAVIARRLTESPRALTGVRETVPRGVDAIATRALARAPADRFATAGAMADALDAVRHGDHHDEPTVTRSAAPADARPTAAGATAAARPVGRRALVLAALAGVVIVAAVVLARSRANRPVGLDATVVAVAPFDVLDPSLALWREGLVDLLSRNLDGAGPLRAVAPTTVIRRWQGRADRVSAARLGHATGAGLALYGSVLGAGRDSVRLRATLFDVAHDRPVDEWEVADEAGRVDRAADSLTLHVLEALGRTRAIGAAKLAPVGSTSLPALKAFLQGEQFFRRTNWDSSYAYYQRAIALDGTFAPALRRASAVVGWASTGYDSLSTAYALAAGAHNHGLSPRDSLLVLGDSLLASLFQSGPLASYADSAWSSRLRRTFATADEATRRYPDDPEAWFLLGEAADHFGPFAGRPTGEIVRAFDRTIALDSAFAPAYIHPIEASAKDGPEAIQRYLRPYLALTPKEEEAEGARLLAALLAPGVAAADVPRLTRTASMTGLFSAHIVLGTLPDREELGVALMQVAHAREPGGPPPFATRSLLDLSTSRMLMARGHLATAAPLIEALDTMWLYPDAVLIGAVPPDSAAVSYRGRLRGRLSPLLIGAFPWWAGRRDTASLATAGGRADSLARHGSDPAGRALGRYAAGAAVAYMALARGDTTAALERFTALSADGCPGCYLDRLTTAQLLAARGRDREAWAILRADHPSATLSPFPTAVLWVLLRGRVAERLGDRETALRSYAWVAGMWQHADSVLVPYATEAREGVARLSAEPR